MKYYPYREADNDVKAEDLLSKIEVQQGKFKFTRGYKVHSEYGWLCKTRQLRFKK